MSIPINNLKRHNDSIANEIESAMRRVVSSGWYVLGPEVEAFEAEFADFCTVDHCIGVASGTEALELSLRALGIGVGDEVALVANAGMYGTTAIKAVGAEPLYVDIDFESMVMDASSLAASITERTLAIIVTHLYGQMADMDSLLDVADRAGISVIEDCAQAHGARFRGKPAGSFGVMGCFSFYPTKNLGALGDAGAVVTKNEGLARQIRMLRQYGWEQKYRTAVPGGINSRLDELQAAVLRAKLPHLEEWNERRRSIATRYSAELSCPRLAVPQNLEEDFVAHLYVIRSPQRERIRTYLHSQDIHTDVHYPVPDHQQAIVSKCSTAVVSLPFSERCCDEVLTIPCFPEMEPGEIEHVIEAIRYVSD